MTIIETGLRALAIRNDLRNDGWAADHSSSKKPRVNPAGSPPLDLLDSGIGRRGVLGNRIKLSLTPFIGAKLERMTNR